MSDISNGCSPNGTAFKEAVCIDAGRVYDSCCDRDCLEDLQCYFAPETQALINNAISVRLKEAEVLNVYVDVEPVNFNKGFYSCDLTFFFLLAFDLITAPRTSPQTIHGITAFTKKVILYGSDGNVKIFSSENTDNGSNANTTSGNINSPKCVVQVVEPVCLSARIGESTEAFCNIGVIPQFVCNAVGGDIQTTLSVGTPTIYATIGMFSIVQLIRNVQMLIPVYDFSIPEKQCDGTTDQPCEAFKKIKFPTNDFFPPRAGDTDNTGCCGNN